MNIFFFLMLLYFVCCSFKAQTLKFSVQCTAHILLYTSFVKVLKWQCVCVADVYLLHTRHQIKYLCSLLCWSIQPRDDDDVHMSGFYYRTQSMFNVKDYLIYGYISHLYCFILVYIYMRNVNTPVGEKWALLLWLYSNKNKLYYHLSWINGGTRWKYSLNLLFHFGRHFKLCKDKLYIETLLFLLHYFNLFSLGAKPYWFSNVTKWF